MMKGERCHKVVHLGKGLALVKKECVLDGFANLKRPRMGHR